MQPPRRFLRGGCLFWGMEEFREKSRLRHFAFRVSPKSFPIWRARFESLGLPYTFEDHYHFHSLYIQDPDGYEVELTMEVSHAPKS